jgi:fermentation-respiration switch protein FrsA (DUF1100 family)
MSFVQSFVEGLLWSPDRRSYWRADHFGLAGEAVTIAGPQGSRLAGLWLPAVGAARGAVLHLHAGSANHAQHLAQVAWLPPAGWGVLMFDYRGFGSSAGAPSLAGMAQDAQCALAWLLAQHGAQGLAIFGQGLGGALAPGLALAQPQGVRLVVIESAWASYRGLMRARYGPGVGHVAAGQMPEAAADPATALARLSLPVIIVQPERDGGVPTSEAAALLAAAPAQREAWRVPATRHLHVFAYPNEWRERLLQRLESAMPGEPQPGAAGAGA